MTKSLKEILESVSPDGETLKTLEVLAEHLASRAEVFDEVASRWGNTKAGKEQRMMDTGIAAGYRGASETLKEAITEITSPQPEQPLSVQIAAAKLRVALDQRLNRVTPEWVKTLSEK